MAKRTLTEVKLAKELVFRYHAVQRFSFPILQLPIGIFFQILLSALMRKMKAFAIILTSFCHCYVCLFLNNLSSLNDAKSRKRRSNYFCSDLFIFEVQKNYTSHSCYENSGCKKTVLFQVPSSLLIIDDEISSLQQNVKENVAHCFPHRTSFAMKIVSRTLTLCLVSQLHLKQYSYLIVDNQSQTRSTLQPTLLVCITRRHVTITFCF